MPLTREQSKFVTPASTGDTIFLPTVAINNNLGVSGTSVFDGPVSFNNSISLNPGTSLTANTITSTTKNTTNLFVSNQASIGTTSQLAQLTVVPSVAGRRGLTVRDIAGTTTQNLFRVESSAGSNIFSVDTSSGIVMSTLLNLSNNQIVNAGTLYISAPSYYSSVGKYYPTIYVNNSNVWQSLLISSPTSGTPRVDPITIITSGTNVPLLEINGSGEIFARNSSRTPLTVRGMRSDVPYQCSITSMTGNGSTVTYNTGLTSGNPFVVGSVVTITGASTAGFNGTFVITTADNAGFVVANTTTGASSSATATSVGHTADLVQYLNPAGTVIGGINSVSQPYTGSTTTINTQVGGAVTAATHNGTTATITLTSASNLAVGDQIVVTGFTPSGWNGTHIVTAVSNSSPFTVSYANANPGGAGAFGIVSTPAQDSVIARSAGTIGQIIRGAASQSADLQQWQSSTPSTLASISSAGNFSTIGNISATNDTARVRAIRSTATAQTTGLGADNGSGWVGSETNTQFQILTNNTARMTFSAAGSISTPNSFNVTNLSNVLLSTDSGGSISMGRTDGTATSPYIDFNSGATAVDYDTRIQASGGTGTVGQGVLTILGNLIQNVNTTAKTGAYTLNYADANTLVQMNGAFAFTVPLNSTTPFAVGTTINLLALTAGVSVTFTGGITSYATPGTKLRAAGSMATLIKLGTDTWVLTGDLTA